MSRRPDRPVVAVTPPVRSGVVADPDWIAAYAVHAEACGFESITLVEHPVVIAGHDDAYPYSPDGRWVLAHDTPLPDPLDTLAYLAAATSTLGLATGVLVLPAHHPVVLAKRLATVDRLSGGRLRCCVGLGWMREELEACGADFEARGDLADEAIDLMRALWAASPEGATVDGPTWQVRGAISRPTPVRPGGVPLHIGGHSRAAARRAGRRGDGFQPLGLDPAALADRMGVLRDAADAAGRDPDAIELTLGGSLARCDPEALGALTAQGAHRVVLSATGDLADLGAACDELSAAASRLALGPQT